MQLNKSEPECTHQMKNKKLALKNNRNKWEKKKNIAYPIRINETDVD